MLRDHYTPTIYIFQMMIARPKWILNASVVALSNLNGVYVAGSLSNEYCYPGNGMNIFHRVWIGYWIIAPIVILFSELKCNTILVNKI